ncbi:hypothetical protein MPER_12712 [Moniliophthora perniciosa FA553]|nr:hypothetical protein MPER_12712 [Moniliophthora perniciosa FA553]
MRAFDNLLLAIFLIPHLVHSFQINPPGNIDVNTRAIASYKRLKGEPESWNLILRSTDSDIPDKRLVGVGISDDFEYADSVAFTCVRPGTYWIDAVSTDKSQLLNQVFARSNYIQAVRGFVLPTGTTTTSPPPPSSTSDTSKSEISTPPPTTSISEISTSSSPTFLVNNSQIELQRSSARPELGTIQPEHTYLGINDSQCSNRHIIIDTFRLSDVVTNYRPQLE